MAILRSETAAHLKHLPECMQVRMMRNVKWLGRSCNWQGSGRVDRRKGSNTNTDLHSVVASTPNIPFSFHSQHLNPPPFQFKSTLFGHSIFTSLCIKQASFRPLSPTPLVTLCLSDTCDRHTGPTQPIATVSSRRSQPARYAQAMTAASSMECLRSNATYAFIRLCLHVCVCVCACVCM
ncbi:unnamed protein product [Protopolystoma xenopodis]|uniref:Uncharacterized protein n=1 Tax=Protopolystoma xenopodis TaxID=117903 RepID=A0A448WR41_9PLAT|nr:unnamed protein product [Protopolystoma xenopodis]